ncbi:glycoside hydrolase family protein [Sphingobacterium mizutaii]|uniref:glycoside hydrolase family protein n=1 Tax=Sphingobacterium mizutaii TaxID=1010 RepID=UPI00289BA3A6|nr:peptidoglycan-binding protein [Sphingobacterium mizutaii]
MEEIKQLSDSGIQFLIKEEGLVKRPYLDSVGIPTIGIGMTYYPSSGKKVRMTDAPLTTEKAISEFRLMVKTYEMGVYSVTRDDINHNQFDSMTSLCYNIGTAGFKGSTLVRKVNANPNDREGIQAAFELWKNAGKKPILLGRRRREAALYFTPDRKIGSDDQYVTHVKMVQSKLKLPVDGIFGPQTKAAVIVFQKKHKLVADGIVGPQTLKFLNKL